MKKIKVLKLPHGYFRGYIKDAEIIDTIESSIGRYDIAIVELVASNELTQRERESLCIPIRNNSQKGYILGFDGDGIDLGVYRQNHRGSVKHQISHTIKTECDCGVLIIEQDL